MRFIRNIALSLVACFAVLLAGLPAYAHQETGNAGVRVMSSEGIQYHHTEHNSKSCLCCGVSSVALVDSQCSLLPQFIGKSVKIHITEQTLLSRTLQTQDRPPKYIS